MQFASVDVCRSSDNKYLTLLTACSIKTATALGLETWIAVAARHLKDGSSGRLAMNCCAGYGIILSSRTWTYQLGLDFQAGPLIASAGRRCPAVLASRP